LKRQFAEGSELAGVPHHAAISTAATFLIRAQTAGDQALQSDTIAFLRQMALDPAVSAQDRAQIPRYLANHLPHEEWALFVEAVNALESD
jgi:hypothetical protein